MWHVFSLWAWSWCSWIFARRQALESWPASKFCGGAYTVRDWKHCQDESARSSTYFSNSWRRGSRRVSSAGDSLASQCVFTLKQSRGMMKRPQSSKALTLTLPPSVVVSQCDTTTILRRLLGLSRKIPTAIATRSRDLDKVPGDTCPEDDSQLLHLTYARTHINGALDLYGDVGVPSVRSDKYATSHCFKSK